MRRIAVRSLIVLALLIAAGAVAWQASPWPRVLVLRQLFAADADRRNAALEPLVPAGIAARTALPYGDDPREAMDVFLPPGAGPRATIVWVHGGAFVGGDRSDLTAYLKILAGRGFATVAVGYPLSPSARWPAQARSVNAALGRLAADASSLGLDLDRLILAGDSAGAHIAAEVAALNADPAVAAALGIVPALGPGRIDGVALFCGVYDAATLPDSSIFRTVRAAVLGTADASDPRLPAFAVAPRLGPAFPPAFVSVGNADGLAPQSHALAERLDAVGVPVETLFWPQGHDPPLGHEYQFELATAEGREALERLVEWAGRP